jgi:general secretion pathway protein M
MKLPKIIAVGTAAPPAVAALVYAGLIVVLVAVVVTSWSGVFNRKATVDGLNEVLARLSSANPARGANGDADGSGSYLVEGPTITVAGAAMLQRIIGIVSKHGGTVLSSQVDLQGTQAKDGFVTVIASCTMDQAALQQVVYDIEAGTPFLFVDQLNAQASATSTDAGSGAAAPKTEGKLRVLLSISGQWQGAR